MSDNKQNVNGDELAMDEDTVSISDELKQKLDAFNEAVEEVKHEGPSYEELKQAYEAEKLKSEENWEKLLRKEAEMQNIQRRAAQELEKVKNYAIEKFVTDLLVVADSFEQALNNQSNEVAPELKAFFDGMALTQKCFVDVLEKFEVKVVSPQLGDSFDPSKHEALSMQESTDFEPNKVMMVIQNGYNLNGRLIRPARVVISRASAQK